MRARAILYLGAVFFVACCSLIVAGTGHTKISAATGPPTPSPVIPFVVPGQQGSRDPSDFYAFSWSEFMALNWPAKVAPGQPPMRGVADPGVTIGAPGPRVWETWKSDFELFPNQPNGPSSIVQPTAWSSWDQPEPICDETGNVTSAGTKVLPLVAKGTSVIPGGVNQAMAGPLVDQHLQYVRYEIRINQAEYEDVKNKQWFLRKNLTSYPQPPNLLPSSSPGKYGAIEIKAAWRILTDAEANANPKRFYTSSAWVVDPKNPGHCTKAVVGLVGLHIAHKTAEFAGWVWSTFEQVDNVPAPGVSPPPQGYSFSSPSPGPAPPFGFAPPTAWKPVPPASLPPKPTVATKVWRINPIPPEAVTLNTAVHALPGISGTVWQFYELVDAQWQTAFPTIKVSNPTTREDLYGQLNAFPTDAVANVTMETYFQGRTAGDATNPLRVSSFGTSCLHCHFAAAQCDFSWVMADQAWPANAAASSRPRIAVKGCL